MKIGILTFHRAHNYGAVLQAFALQECLKNLGHEVDFIDYKHKLLLEVYDNFSLKRIKSRNPLKIVKNLRNEIKYAPIRINRSKNFNQFINNRLILNSEIDKDFLNNNYDAVFVGSDQVWNFHLTKGFDQYYWGYFKDHKSNCRIISYAASMEANKLTIDEKENVRKGLRNFDHISVREDLLKNDIQSLTDDEITVVADPTLIVDSSVWHKIAKKPNDFGPYLLLYQVRNDTRNIELANKIAKEKDLKIVYLSARIDAINSSNFASAAPEEYLGLFKHASFIVCSSFHGAVFSILFNVPFYSILLDDGKDSRCLSLLNRVNLLNRAIRHTDKYDTNALIDWDKVNSQLIILKNESLSFINKSLNEDIIPIR